MIQLHDAGNAGDVFLEVRDLLEVGTQLDDGYTTETVGVHDQLAVLETVEVRLDQQQVGAGLDRQEATTGHVDTVGILEVTDGGTNSGLQLDDRDISLALLVGGDRLLVGDDLHLELVILNDTLDGTQVHPDVVGVEVLELLDGLELVDVILGHLGNFEQTDLAVVVDDGTTLDISLSLVRQLHDVLSLGVNHVLQDTEIDNSTQVISVGEEDDLNTALQQLVEDTGVVQRLEDVTVAGRIPVLQGSVKALGGRQERVLEDTGVARLVEGNDVDIVTLVLLDDRLGVLVGVEGVHENKGDIDVVRAVEVLNLTDRQIQEGHALTDLNDGLGTDATHGGTQTTVELEHSQLVQELDGGGVSQFVVVDDLVRLRRSNAVPVDNIALGLVVQETAVESKEVVHLSLKALLLLGLGDGLSQRVQSIAHLRSGDTGGGILESL